MEIDNQNYVSEYEHIFVVCVRKREVSGQTDLRTRLVYIGRLRVHWMDLKV